MHTSDPQHPRSLQLTVPENFDIDGGSLVGLLATEAGLSRIKIKDAMAKGAVWRESIQAAGVLGKPRHLRRATGRVAVGDRVSLYFNPAVLAASCPNPVLVADHRRYSVWDKPAGMLCQGSRWGDHLTLNRWAEANLQPQRTAYVVHRLDRMASGLVVLAHDKRAAASLSRQFAERSVTKRYHCIVQGELAGASLPIALEAALDGKPALTYIEQVQPAQRWLAQAEPERAGQGQVEVLPGGLSLLTLRIATGRKHQIRRHLAEFGYPIVGDRQYGGVSPRTQTVRSDAAPPTCNCARSAWLLPTR